jgi:hypothetical protein
MITAHRWDCILKGIGWLAGFVDALLLMAVALILINRAFFLTQDNVAYALLALYLANWLFVLALVALALTCAWLLIKAKTVCRQAAL